jgi:WD40 repeat protein
MAAAPVPSPFKGLSAFEDSEVDALLFFGREREREIVVANLIASRLTVLYGPSGVGKSSLLRAAVARALRELPEEPLVVVCSRWSDDPAAALVEAIAEAGGNGASGSPLEALEHAQDGRDVYLVLDQAEEYFLYHADDEGPGSFADALPEVLAAPIRVNVLVSLREDSLAKLDRFTGRIPGLFANTLRLDRLDRAAARKAILRPLERFAALTGEDVATEPALVDRILEEVGTGQIEPVLGGLGAVEGTELTTRIEAPYLQLVLQRLWEEERRVGSNLLRVGTLERLGGAQHIVEVHLDDAMAQLEPGQKDVAALLFSHLVTPSGTKIAHEVTDLADFGDVPVSDVRPILQALTASRILRSLEEGGDVRYEIFHDVLAQPVLAWRAAHEADRELEAQKRESDRRQQRLLALVAVGGVLLAIMSGVTVYAVAQRNEAQKQAARAEASRADAEREAARAEQQQAAAESAEQAAVDSAALAKRSQAEAEEQRAQAEASEAQAEEEAERAEDSAAQAQEAEREAQDATRQAESEAARAEQEADAADAARSEAEQSADEAERSANEAQARALAEEALTLLAVRPLESLRLALESAELEETRLAERVLRASLVSSRVRYVLPGGGGPVVDATFSPDGRRVVVVANRARVYDARTGELVRALTDLRGVSAATFSPDGATVVTAGRDGVARLWPVEGGSAKALTGHTGVVRDVAFSRDGRLVATAGDDRTARVWDATSGEQLTSFAHDGPVLGVEVNAGGTHVLTVSRVARTGRMVSRLFDLAAGADRTLDERGVTTAIFAPDGSYAVTTNNDDFARVWDFAASQPRASLHHPDGNVLSAAFDRDGTKLLTTSEGSSATAWDTDTWQKDQGFIGPLNPATGATFNPSGRFVVVTSRDRNAHLFNAGNGLRVAILSGHTEEVSSASFSSDGRLLVTASDDGSARVWDPGTEDLLELVGRRSGPMRSVAPSPDGRLAVSAGADGTARILNVERRRELAVLRHGAAVNTAVFSPDGRLVLTASDDGTARLWRPDGQVVATLTHGGQGVRATFSPDGSLVATGGDDRTVRLWRVRDGRRLHVLRGHAGTILDLAFSSDGRLLASAGDNADKTARIWRVDAGRALHVLRHRGPVVRVVFSPDGRLLATASGDEMGRLWSAETGKLRRALRGHTAFVRDISFRRDGRVLVTASDDGDARTWSPRTGATLQVLRGHFSAVRGARFSPDGRWIVTAGPRTALLWDARTGEHFAPTGLADPFLRGPTLGPVSAAVFTPDGRRIVTASADGTVRAFECTVCGRVDELVRLAQRRLSSLERGLSASERRRYLRA